MAPWNGPLVPRQKCSTGNQDPEWAFSPAWFMWVCAIVLYRCLPCTGHMLLSVVTCLHSTRQANTRQLCPRSCVSHSVTATRQTETITFQNWNSIPFGHQQHWSSIPIMEVIWESYLEFIQHALQLFFFAAANTFQMSVTYWSNS